MSTWDDVSETCEVCGAAPTVCVLCIVGPSGWSAPVAACGPCEDAHFERIDQMREQRRRP